MICWIDGRVVAGRAVDVDAAVDAATVATAVRDGHATDGSGRTVAVLARRAGPLHERVGCVAPDPAVRPRTALAAAARSLGWTTPVDDDLERARKRLAAHGSGSTDGDAPGTGGDGASHRRRLAAATDEADRLRERVAEARGRVRATDDAGADGEAGAGDDAGRRADDGGPAAAMESAVRSLSEVETTLAAAREDHRAARAEARAARDCLQERLRLQDAVANLEREARAALVERARPAYESALAAVPGESCPADPFDAPPDAMALAVARVGDLAAPMVVASDRFDGAAAAARWLDAPAIRLDP